MPVRRAIISFHCGKRGGLLMRTAGAHQVVPDRGQRERTNLEREVGDGDVARDLVLGVPGWKAEEKDLGHDTRREDVM